MLTLVLFLLSPNMFSLLMDNQIVASNGNNEERPHMHLSSF